MENQEVDYSWVRSCEQLTLIDGTVLHEKE